MDADSGSGALDFRWDLRPSEGKIINSDGILYTLLLDAKMPTFSILTCRFASKVWKKKRSLKYTVYFLNGRRKSLILACLGIGSASKVWKKRRNRRYTVYLVNGRK